ncbi:hypothetical protein BASA81_002034 [Batrachochytrium salamandrivorans]|nr:hypothetical protein BASA81_002034 [Batrachochytrium salamandrivorans]
MGVPAFFRWISEKYPKITQKCIEEDPTVFADGTELPVDATEPNPMGMEFDNLYLDMNGIIHPCTHPEDGSPALTRDQMMLAIAKHIDRLFRLIRPRKLLYMAIDGIAPRAKMNQQRSRRFRAAQEADEAREDREKVKKAMRQQGMKPPSEADKPPAFDSNVITPGTEFMDQLAEFLRFFIIERQKHDPAWQSCKVILSDSQSPGEGEHKIMQFIRRQRAEPGHDPNCHHVMYGLDADLIMLGLASHEVHFTVLRDQVLFGKQNRKAGFKQDSVLTLDAGVPSPSPPPPISISKLKPIEMLHVWILREYLANEFRQESFQTNSPGGGGGLKFPYDFERCIDDFVFLCFFVGNDFLPHLPSLSIRESGLELLLNIYRKVMPTLDGYLTQDGDIMLNRVEALMTELGQVEDRIFQIRRAQEEREKNRRTQLAKQGGENPNNRKLKTDMRTLAPTHINTSELANLGSQEDRNRLAALQLKAQLAGPPTTQQNKSAALLLKEELAAAAAEEKVTPCTVEQEEEELLFGDESISFEDKVKVLSDKRNKLENADVDVVKLHEQGWKDRYYESKFGKEFIDPSKRRAIVESYVLGLCWVIQYYYQGCQSWKWYYDFHYSPFASDLVNLMEIRVDWPQSRPFKPFEQLMAVLPPQSAHALPPVCRPYMTNPQSEIADFYPTTLEYDPNGKGTMRWLWVALLPFINEARLLEITAKCEEEFDEDAKRRNAMMPDLLFVGRNSVGSGNILQVLTKSPANHILHNWESDQLAVLERGQQQSKLFESALHLPAPTTAGDARGGGNDQVYLTSPDAGGLCGFFFPVTKDFAVQLGDRVETVNRHFSDSIADSDTFVCEFRLPPMRPHLSQLCVGVKIPPAVLGEEDMRVKKPRLSGIDVSLLLNDNSASSSGLERSWGSQEPERIYKRHQQPNQQQQQNFLLHPSQSYQGYNYAPPAAMPATNAYQAAVPAQFTSVFNHLQAGLDNYVNSYQQQHQYHYYAPPPSQQQQQPSYYPPPHYPPPQQQQYPPPPQQQQYPPPQYYPPPPSSGYHTNYPPPSSYPPPGSNNNNQRRQ